MKVCLPKQVSISNYSVTHAGSYSKVLLVYKCISVYLLLRYFCNELAPSWIYQNLLYQLDFEENCICIADMHSA